MIRLVKPFSVSSYATFSSIDYTDPSYSLVLRVRRLDSQDTARQDAYQRLRATRFVSHLGWQIAVDAQGRERDQYDLRADPSIFVSGVYGVEGMGAASGAGVIQDAEVLLGGVRIFALRDWQDSMVTNEFASVGMLPDTALASLTRQYACQDLLEITRLCVQRGHWYPSAASASPRFPCAIARDLVYAAVYQVAEQTGRELALALVTTGYAQVMQRSHFVFREIMTHHPQVSSGYALTVIDLAATFQAIDAAGESARAERMTALCRKTFLRNRCFFPGFSRRTDV